jgi:hypothetical protein
MAVHLTRTFPERMYGQLLQLPLQDLLRTWDVSVGAGGGSAHSARTSTEGAAPTTPHGAVIDSMRQWSIVGSVGPLYEPGRHGRTQVRATRAVPVARTSLGRPQVILGRAAGRRSGGRSKCALLTRFAFGDDNNIGSLGFIAAVTRTTGS